MPTTIAKVKNMKQEQKLIDELALPLRQHRAYFGQKRDSIIRQIVRLIAREIEEFRDVTFIGRDLEPESVVSRFESHALKTKIYACLCHTMQ